jgi:HEPN domain-containing protein
MADDDPSGDQVAKEWPLEGHFVVGGSGLYVSTDCLGRTFTSRTAKYDLTIGLPQLDTGSTPPGRVIPPEWTYGPRDESERANERDVIPWGWAPGYGAKKVYPETAKNAAIGARCRFYTTLTASNDNEFNTAADDFLTELDEWWTRFTSWVGILTVQDFVGLGGYTRRGTRSGSLSTWTSNEHGERAGRDIRSYFTPNRGIPMSVLELQDLQACVTATGNQDPPPAEWQFIRDARALLNAGQNRRAVIDAGMAAELAMTTLIDKYLDDTNAQEPVRDALARGYNNLGAKKELLKLLRPGLLSARVQPDLIDKRNTASHGGDQITFEQAQTAVEIATEIVESAHPLASLLPTQTT